MPYLGNTPSTSFATVVKDSFNGGSTAYTLSKVATTNSVSVFVENVRQEPTTAYAVSGTTLTFTATTPSGTGNIYVLHMNPTTTTTHPAAQALTATTGTFTSTVDVNGNELILDADADTSITADTDDQIDIKIAGADDFQFTANTFTAQSGSTIAAQALTATTVTATGDISFNGGNFVFNESGAAKDFRIEGDTFSNLFICDGSEDDIGMGLTPSFTSGNGLHLADGFKIGFGAGGNSRPDFQLGYNTSTDELELACGFGADTADLFITTGGTLGFNLGGGSTCLKFEDADNSSYTVMTMVNATYNGGTNKIATFNTTKLSLDPQNSESLLLGTDGSLRLQHVYDDTTSNSANMYIHSDGTHQVLRSTSSERYKKDIETLEDKYADAVLGLRPVWYKSKCEADNADHSHWGLIAEEVAKVDPRLVTFRHEITTSNNDPDTLETIIKTTKLDEPQAESVQYDRFVPHLINICKRQEDKITALEAKVKALESK